MREDILAVAVAYVAVVAVAHIAGHTVAGHRGPIVGIAAFGQIDLRMK